MSLALLPPLALGLSLALAHEEASQPAPLLVHEWGTFTCLQDASGRALGGVNSDEEPVPAFVHRLFPLFLVGGPNAAVGMLKGAPRCHPDVTLRLETPVAYFYPGAAHPNGLQLDVSVEFERGWLTEWYPSATPAHPAEARAGSWKPGPITAETRGGLSWNGLAVGGFAPGPPTDDPVWLSPRVEQASSITTREGETERYLFYRGVAHLDAPLAVRTSSDGERFELYAQLDPELGVGEGLPVLASWLVDVRADGALAYRELGGLWLARDAGVLATTPSRFAPEDYAAEQLAPLRESMVAGLIVDGLYRAEAEAMLDTWEHAYLQAPGLRLFFLVPDAWTDAVLPLELSVPAQVERAMVGRIELVTAEQREHLEQIAHTPYEDGDWFQDMCAELEAAGRIDDLLRVQSSLLTGDLPELPAPYAVPDSYAAYLELGRFRDALLLDELRQAPTEALRLFAKAHGICAWNGGLSAEATD